MASISMSTTGRSTATSSGCARSSRSSMASSRRSRRFMASDTGTAIASAAPAALADAPRAAGHAGARARPRRRFSPLTLRILAVNVLALALLGIGLLFLGEYESSLIDTELQALKTQGEIFAAALGEGAVIDSVAEGEELIPELGRQMMRRLVEPTRTRAR